MKIGIISDIHSNYEALNSILFELKKNNPGIIYSLGDVVGYGASPNECFETLTKNKVISILGNHDYAVVTDDDDFMNDVAKQGVKFTRKEMKDEYKNVISNWDFVRHIDRMVMFHGMPDEERIFDYILFRDDVIDAAEFIHDKYPDTIVAFFGHTHTKAIYEYDFETRKIEMVEIGYEWIKLRTDRFYLINPGSVGQSREGESYSVGVVYDKKEHMVKYIKAEYDISAEAQKIKKAGLPDFISERLYRGL